MDTEPVDYDSHEFEQAPAPERRFGSRFTDWVNGHKDWRNLTEKQFEFGLKDSEFEQPLSGPRLFISYKSLDRKLALEVARIARMQRIAVWLDVLDPTLLQVTKSNQPAAVAAIIEIALMNCSHLIAIMSSNTIRSTWVPYEFGRVKPAQLYSEKTSSWITDQSLSIPEYLELCPRHYSHKDIHKWLYKQITTPYLTSRMAPPIAHQSKSVVSLLR